MRKIDTFQRILDIYKELRDQAMKSNVPVDVFKVMFMAGLSSKFDYSFEEAEKIVEVLESFISEEGKGNVN